MCVLLVLGFSDPAYPPVTKGRLGLRLSNRPHWDGYAITTVEEGCCCTLQSAGGTGDSEINQHLGSHSMDYYYLVEVWMGSQIVVVRGRLWTSFMLNFIARNF